MSGWEKLLSIIEEGRAEFEAEHNSPPVACPNDGELLQTGPDGELYCPFDGWRPEGSASAWQ